MMPSPPLASARPAVQAAATPDIAASAAIGLDNSSPEAFIRGIAPYAERVSRATGIPAEALIGMACNETGYGKYAPGNNLFGIKGTGPAGSFSTPTWEDYGNGPVTITDNFRAYHSPAESFLDFAVLVTTSPRYKNAVGQTTVAGFVDGLRQGGYMTDPDYVNKISAITTRYSSVIQSSLADTGTTSARGAAASAGLVPSGGRGMLVLDSSASGSVMTAASVGSATSGSAAVSAAARPSAGVTVPNQFAIGLAPEEAYAACGPVAAIAFAQVYGRNPTPTEAMQLAKQSGWTPDGGMNGIANEKRLLDKMGLPSRLETGANWDHIRADALQHQPVIVSTPGHYFVIDGFDAGTGAYHVGQSGKAYRGGSDWLTPAQIEMLAGTPSGALFTLHPLAGQTREVLPPQPEVIAQQQQREILPPLDLGNTPPPPPIPPTSGRATPVAAPIPDEPPPISAAPPPPIPPTPGRATPVAAPIPDEPPPISAAPPPPPTPAAQPFAAPPPPYAPVAAPASASPVAPAPVTAAPASAPPVAPAPATAAPDSAASVAPAPVAAQLLAPSPVAPAPAASAPVAPATIAPGLVPARAPVTAAQVVPAPVVPVPPAAGVGQDPPTLIAAAPPTPAPDTARPGPVGIPEGLAVGAVAAGSAQKPTVPPPPRRRPDDNEFDPR